MDVELFARTVQDVHVRLTELYRGVNVSVPELDNVLPKAFKELGTASEELQVAAEELFQQTNQLAALQSQVEVERQRYKQLFEFLPKACLVTDASGKIQEANSAAGTLLNVEPSLLEGKLLVNFISIGSRRMFRSRMEQLHQFDWVQEWTISMQPHHREPFDAGITVASTRDCQSGLFNLRWLVHDISDRKRTLQVLKSNSNNYDPSEHRPLHFYAKREIIPLEPSSLWLVRHGMVKLSTMNENSDEVLLGLVGRSMPFGSGMTSLPIYQATVLSESAELACISLSEIAASSHLMQALLPQINQRLRQTETLLAISGKRQVKDRLDRLLQFLKQEIGQRVTQGIRLSVHLTHQELADACCTTRVTITRLLGKLQKQGKITFDSKRRLILLNEHD